MQNWTPWGLAVALALVTPVAVAATAVAPTAADARPVNGFWSATASVSQTGVHSSLTRATCRRERFAWFGETVLLPQMTTRKTQTRALRRSVVARRALVKCEASLRFPKPVPPGTTAPGAAPPENPSAPPEPAAPPPPGTTPLPETVIPPPVAPTEASVTVNGLGDGASVSASGAITLTGDALVAAPAGTNYTLSLRTPYRTRPSVGCQRGQDSPVFKGPTGTFTAPASHLAPFCTGAAMGTLWAGPPGAILGDEGTVNVARVTFDVVAP